MHSNNLIESNNPLAEKEKKKQIQDKGNIQMYHLITKTIKKKKKYLKSVFLPKLGAHKFREEKKQYIKPEDAWNGY